MEASKLTLARGDVRAEILPAMGAFLTRFSVGARELLYLDEASLATSSKRGGVPVLFPSPGRLKNDLFAAEGRYGSLKNHGFARDFPFTVVASDAASVTLRLEANDETLARFPWDFALEMRVSLTDRALRYDVRVENNDGEKMPFGFGLHPYFAVSDKPSARAVTAAKRAFDNRAKKSVTLDGPIDFANGEVDMHLVDHGIDQSIDDHGSNHLVLATSDGGVRVAGSHEFKTWVLWTLPDKSFVCVEPWTSPGNALNTGTDLIQLAPGETRDLWVEIAAL